MTILEPTEGPTGMPTEGPTQNPSPQRGAGDGFRYLRTIRFAETDAAGVMYFANLLTLCHEAYEAALENAGFDLQLFFSRESDVAVPIVHTSADFYQPMRCGDAIAVHLTPTQISPHTFEIRYEIHRAIHPQTQQAKTAKTQRPIATALTRHVCIDVKGRDRQPLPLKLAQWISS